jgi:hypothetical protein
MQPQLNTKELRALLFSLSSHRHQDVIMLRLLWISLAISLFLAGCAVEKTQLGTSKDEVVAQYGAPSRTVPLANGSRLQYSRQPMGQTAVMVDLDAAGKVVSVRQVLTANDFARIEVGIWTRELTEQEFGRPAYISHVANWRGDILTYRWQHHGSDMLFYVHLDANNIVQQVGQAFEYREPRESTISKLRPARMGSAHPLIKDHS